MGLITLFFRYSSTTWPTWARLGAETTCLPTLPSPLEPNLREDWETISFDWKAQIMRPRRRPWWLPSQRLNLSPCDVWCTTVNDATSQHRVSKKEFLEKTDQSPVSSSQWHPESSLEFCWGRLIPGLSEQWAVVAQGSRHHRLHPGADGTREHRRQHGVSQGEGRRTWGKQGQKVKSVHNLSSVWNLCQIDNL